LSRPAADTVNGDFIVKESRVINFILSGLFFAIFIYSIVHPLGTGWTIQVYSFTLILGGIFFYKGFRTKTEVLINASGIYTFGKLMTDWDHFAEATIVHDEVAFSISDNWRLLITYREGNKVFREKIALKNSHTKAEEEIIEAIRHFYAQHQNAVKIIDPPYLPQNVNGNG
jgi:hypothetical protein